MRTPTATLLLVAVLGVVAAPPVRADSGVPAPLQNRGSKGRVLGTTIGAAAGLGLGVVAGLSWFDDAINSDRKAWATAIGFAGAGGVAGYFIGRSVDRRSRKQTAVGPALRGPTWPGELDPPSNLEWRNRTRDLPRAR